MMKRFLTTTAIALFIGAAPALAAEDSSKMEDQSGTLPEASQSAQEPSSALPSDPGMMPDASEPSQPQAAAEPQEGQEGALPTQPGTTRRLTSPRRRPNLQTARPILRAAPRSAAPQRLSSVPRVPVGATLPRSNAVHLGEGR